MLGKGPHSGKTLPALSFSVARSQEVCLHTRPWYGSHNPVRQTDIGELMSQRKFPELTVQTSGDYGIMFRSFGDHLDFEVSTA